MPATPEGPGPLDRAAIVSLKKPRALFMGGIVSLQDERPGVASRL
jgi:hypothetical protein